MRDLGKMVGKVKWSGLAASCRLTSGMMKELLGSASLLCSCPDLCSGDVKLNLGFMVPFWFCKFIHFP